MSQTDDLVHYLSPYYKKKMEISYEELDRALCSSYIWKDKIPGGGDSYNALTASLSQTQALNQKYNVGISEESFNDEVDELFSQFPEPPLNCMINEKYTRVTNIPASLFCEGNTSSLFEEMLYGNQDAEKLVNSGVTRLLERFLYMRQESTIIPYIDNIRTIYEDKSLFAIRPRCIAFTNKPFDLNAPWETRIAIENLSALPLDLSIESIPSVEDANYEVQFDDHLFIKKGSTSFLRVSIKFLSRSVRLSHLFLLSCGAYRDFLCLSASSKPQVYGIDPRSLPCSTVQKHDIPVILELLKQKLISCNGLQTQGIFRIACRKEEADNAVDMINLRYDEYRGYQDIPSDDPYVLSALINRFYRHMPHHILDGLSKETILQCSSEKDFVKLFEEIEPFYQHLLDWAIDLFVLIAKNESVNKMSPKNCAVCFTPNVFGDDESITSSFIETVQQFIESLIVLKMK